MSFLVIANIFSGITAIFTIASSWVPNKRKSFILEVFQCLFYAVASYFFGAYASITTMVLCAVRCWLLAIDKYDLKACMGYCVAVLVIGIFANNAGLLGFIPVVAAVQSAVCNYAFRTLIGTKWTIFANMLLWSIYDFFIFDIASFLVDSFTLIVSIAAIIRITKGIKSGTISDSTQLD